MLPEWPFAGCRDALPVVFTIALLTQVVGRSGHAGGLAGTTGPSPAA
jgi:hypothetical protein